MSHHMFYIEVPEEMNTKKRKREYNPISSDEYDTDSGVCSIEEFNAGKDKYQCTMLGALPTPYPFSQGIASQASADVIKKQGDETQKVLSKYAITFSGSMKRKLWPKARPADAIDTLVIMTDNTDSQNWKDACTDIYALLLQGGLVGSTIKVEIWNEALRYKDVSFAIPSDDPRLIQALKSVQDDVAKIVLKDLPDIVTSIAYHMRGPSQGLVGDRKPTIMVHVKHKSRHLFQVVEDKIDDLLSSKDFPGITISTKILGGEIKWGTNKITETYDIRHNFIPTPHGQPKPFLLNLTS
ncbi:uncharacterized protein PAC_01696 [Phialocephala subalpina]|uniref:Uncharacterized protein n=1 Tax=Phialocephala subalpina TaxID=576137 RepID=A0A1L7WGB1_9HELO|nr:uncharacterized protein PAC_01696 [Phialocephala subalpina]